MKKLQSFFEETAPEFGVILAYFFGSRSEGSPGPLSDYDFAVLYADKLLRKQVYKLAQLLGKAVDSPHVDLVVLNRAPVELQYHVIAGGRVIYETSAAVRVEFEARVLSRYFDYLPILRRQRQELLEEEDEDREAGIQRYRKALAKTQRVLAQARTT